MSVLTRLRGRDPVQALDGLVLGLVLVGIALVALLVVTR